MKMTETVDSLNFNKGTDLTLTFEQKNKQTQNLFKQPGYCGLNLLVFF